MINFLCNIPEMAHYFCHSTPCTNTPFVCSCLLYCLYFLVFLTYITMSLCTLPNNITSPI